MLTQHETRHATDSNPTPSVQTIAITTRDPFAHETPRDRLRRRLFETTAALCEANGHRDIVLVGRVDDVWPIARQPWQWRNLRVVGIITEDRAPAFIRGVPTIASGTCPNTATACVICSEENEHMWYERAKVSSQSRSNKTNRTAAPPFEILRPYYEDPSWEPDAVSERRLIEHGDVPRAEACWLIKNRAERHDATLPMLLPSRTELHLRRYEFAAKHTSGKRVADIACGLGYGSRILTRDGAAASVVGVDLDPAAAAYAQSKFGGDRVTFHAGDACNTPLADSCIDIITSFETIEHVNEPKRLLTEFARVLAPGGVLVLSTPNDWGLTEHHVHSFTFESLEALLRDRFDIQGWWTQRATTERLERSLPEGIAARRSASDPAETLLVIAKRRE